MRDGDQVIKEITERGLKVTNADGFLQARENLFRYYAPRINGKVVKIQSCDKLLRDNPEFSGKSAFARYYFLCEQSSQAIFWDFCRENGYQLNSACADELQRCLYDDGLIDEAFKALYLPVLATMPDYDRELARYKAEFVEFKTHYKSQERAYRHALKQERVPVSNVVEEMVEYHQEEPPAVEKEAPQPKKKSVFRIFG